MTCIQELLSGVCDGFVGIAVGVVVVLVVNMILIKIIHGPL